MQLSLNHFCPCNYVAPVKLIVSPIALLWYLHFRLPPALFGMKRHLFTPSWSGVTQQPVKWLGGLRLSALVPKIHRVEREN